MLRLDSLLWGRNLDRHATPAFRFVELGRAVSLAREFHDSLGREATKHGAHHQAASILLGRRVTSLKRIRMFEFEQLRAALDEQAEDNPQIIYGKGAVY